MDREFESILEKMSKQGLNNDRQLFEVFVKATGVTTHVPGGMISGFLNPKDYEIKHVGPNVPGALTGEAAAPTGDAIADAEAQARKIIANAEAEAERIKKAALKSSAPAPTAEAPKAPGSGEPLPTDLAGFEALHWQKAGKLIRDSVNDIELLKLLTSSTKDSVKNPATEKLAALQPVL